MVVGIWHFAYVFWQLLSNLLRTSFRLFFFDGVIYFTAHLGGLPCLNPFYRFPSFSFDLLDYYVISASIYCHNYFLLSRVPVGIVGTLFFPLLFLPSVSGEAGKVNIFSFLVYCNLICCPCNEFSLFLLYEICIISYQLAENL